MRFGRFSKKFFGSLNLTIIGIAVAIALGVYLDSLDGVTKVQAITASLVTSVVFMQLDEIIQEKQFEKVAGLLSKLRKDHELRHTIEVLIDYSLGIKAFGDDDFINRSEDLFHEVSDELSFLADGRTRIDPHEEMTFTINSLKRCKKHLYISSWLDTVDYWESSEGKKYLEETEKLIKKKKVEVIRIFILKECELKNYKSTLENQKSKGINVEIAFEEDLETEEIEAFIIYDNNAVRTETLIRGNQKSAVLSIDKNDVYRYLRKFKELEYKSMSIELAYQRVDQPPSTAECR